MTHDEYTRALLMIKQCLVEDLKQLRDKGLVHIHSDEYATSDGVRLCHEVQVSHDLAALNVTMARLVHITSRMEVQLSRIAAGMMIVPPTGSGGGEGPMVN
jgi:hypothetical protein